MNVVVEILLLLVRVTWLWMVAVYKAVVPARFQKQKNISEQTVLITGAGSGLGRLMSVRFGMLGCRLILWDIDEKGNKQTEELVKAVGAKVSSYKVDLSSRENIYNAADKVKSDIGDVDILVNNAGIVTGKKILDAPESLMQKTMDVNATAHFWTTKCFLPPMLEKNKGHIVSIASSAGLFGVTGLVDYCASKFAAVGFDESLRSEIVQQGKTGVNTTVVCPYFINTGMFDGVKTRFPGMLPILKPEYVVDKIIEAVLTNQEMLILPRSVYVAYMLRGVLPCTVGELVNQFLGIASSMDDFVGRAKSD